MERTSFARFGFVLGSPLLLAACMGSGQPATPSVVDPPDQRDYVYNMNESQRRAAMQQFDAATRAELQYKAELYRRGRPVSFGGITATFQPMLGVTEVNFDHTIQGSPTVSSGKMVFAAGRNGEILGQRDKDGNVIPQALFANAFQGMTGEALFMKGLFSLGGSALNGSVAAALSNGGSGNVAIAQSQSGSSSETNTTTNTTTNSTGGRNRYQPGM